MCLCCVVIIIPLEGGQEGGLLLVSQNRVAMLTRSDAPCVDHIAHEDTAVANLTRMRHIENHLDRKSVV